MIFGSGILALFYGKNTTYDITVSLVGDDEYADNECKTILTVNFYKIGNRLFN